MDDLNSVQMTGPSLSCGIKPYVYKLACRNLGPAPHFSKRYRIYIYWMHNTQTKGSREDTCETEF
jgi:hypothetical protein